jgi:hypothetical protein
MEGDTLGYYLRYLLSQEGLLAFLGIAGCLVYLKTRKRNGLILASFAVPYVVYISTLRIRNDRTILIVLPILLIVAADWLGVAWQRLAQQSPSKWTKVAAVSVIGFVILSFGYQGWNSVKTDVRLTTPDAREYARQWITANIPATARIAAETYTPFLDPAQRSITYFETLLNNAPDWYIAQGFEWIVLSSGAYARFYARPQDYPSEVARYDALHSRFPEAKIFDQNGIVIQILHVIP